MFVYFITLIFKEIPLSIINFTINTVVELLSFPFSNDLKIKKEKYSTKKLSCLHFRYVTCKTQVEKEKYARKQNIFLSKYPKSELNYLFNNKHKHSTGL